MLVSMFSFWEIVVKQRAGKLVADIEEIVGAVRTQGFMRLDIITAHMLALARLPLHHRDPFDHLLIAQAIMEDAVFISEDRNSHRYPVRSVACANPASSQTDGETD